MRLAILSDIHGNLLALEAVLGDLAAQGGADAVVIAGDLCLDGPRPREVLARLRSLGYPIIQGNTDRDLVRPTPEGTDEDHAALLDWTREQIGPAGLEYLDTLPFSHQVADPTGATAVLVVHANPRDLDTHLRPLAPEAAIRPLLADLPPEVAVVAFGHLHIPYTRRVGGILLANIASVGLPKDGDRRASYGLLTWQGTDWAVEQRRVEYAVDEVVAQLRAADPPGAQGLIRQLLRARYANMSEARGGRQSTRPAAPVAAAPARLAAAAIPPRPARPPSPAPAPPPDLSERAGEQAASWAQSQSAEADGPAGTSAAAPRRDVRPGDPTLPPPVPTDAGFTQTVAPSPPGTAPPAEPHDELIAAVPVKPKPKHAGGGKKGKRPPKATPQLAFEATDSFPSILPRLLGERIDAVLAPLATVHEDEDPEGVHDMRVAIRRLRGALEPAAPFYNEKGLKRAVRRVKALARALGRVRDADVHLITLRKRLAKAAPEERAGIEGLIDTIIAERAIARADLDPVLDRWDGPHTPQVAELRAFLSRPKQRKQKDRSRESVAAVALRALTARLDALAATAAVLSATATHLSGFPGDAEALHEVRIVAKQLRYALEIFSPVLGPDIGGLLAELKTLQDLLGELHDRDVLVELLHAERTAAAERELDALDRIAFEAGPRAERLASIRAQLADPASLAATAIGIYGLLIDVTDERAELETATRGRWATLTAAGFLERLEALNDGLRHAIVELAAPPEPTTESIAASAGEA